MNNRTVETEVRELERSERGQMTCKLLRDFLKSSTVQGLDQDNSNAVAFLVARFLLGSGADSCKVLEALNNATKRHPWVERA